MEVSMVVVAAKGLPLVEPVPIVDEYCSGLGQIEDVDGAAARFVLYTAQTVYPSNEPVWVVTKKILLPYKAIPTGIEMATTFSVRHALNHAGQGVLKLVKG
jgi:hypothetical protein